jgi:hypothetical protein
MGGMVVNLPYSTKCLAGKSSGANPEKATNHARLVAGECKMLELRAILRQLMVAKTNCHNKIGIELCNLFARDKLVGQSR